jgi:hypothetical protein
MELDWCNDEKNSGFENFNENTIINKNKKKTEVKILKINENNEINQDLSLEKCFLLNLNENLNDKENLNNNLLLIINYLSFISNHLRTIMRNKSSKFGEIKNLTLEEYNLIIKYLDWLILASKSIKKYFASPIRRDNSFDPSNIKLFKTSSYKFCNFKESCSIHKNKHSKCDKNHFVFDMIINDILKLKESIEIIGLNNINWTLNNKFIKTIFDIDTKKYIMENFDTNINNFEINDNQFIVDKTLIFKSFDVISYVLNKMYEETLYFLNNNIQTILINIY